MNLLHDAVACKFRPGNEQGILQIHLIHLVVAVVGEFRVAGEGQIAGFITVVGDGQCPDLILGIQRHIVKGFGADAGIVRAHPGVAHAVTALRFVQIQGLAHRHPGGRPEIPAVVVPDVQIPSGLVEVIEDIPQNPSVGAGGGETVAAGVVGDNRAIFGRTQIVDPGCRGVRLRDDVLPISVIEVSVLHGKTLLI